MGLMGALGGLGQGMNDYSTMLNDKAKLDWQAQQAAVAYERQKDLENLRISSSEKIARGINDTSIINNANTNATSMLNAGTAADASKYGSDVAGAAHVQGSEIAAKSAQVVANTNAASALAVTTKQGENQIGYAGVLGKEQRQTAEEEVGNKLDLFEESHKLTMKLTQEQRNDSADKLMDVFKQKNKGGELDGTQSLIVGATRAGVDMKLVMKEDGTPMNADMLKQLTELASTDPDWNKKPFSVKLQTIENAYGSLPGVRTGGAEEGPRKSMVNPAEIAKMASDMNSGNKEAIAAYGSLDLASKTAVRSAQTSLITNKGNVQKTISEIDTNFFQPPTAVSSFDSSGMLSGIPEVGSSINYTTDPLKIPGRQGQVDYMSKQKKQEIKY